MELSEDIPLNSGIVELSEDIPLNNGIVELSEDIPFRTELPKCNFAMTLSLELSCGSGT